MKVVCVGADPAALYLGILLKRQDPSHSVGFLLESGRQTTWLPSSIVCNPLKRRLKLADPEVAAAANAEVATFDRVEITIGDHRFATRGLAYASVRTAGLIAALKAIAIGLGCEFLSCDAAAIDAQLESADLVVGADGDGSRVWRPAGSNATQHDVGTNLHFGCESPKFARFAALQFP